MKTQRDVREADGTQIPRETTEQDFQALYQENVTLIYRYVLSKVGNREEAEDLTAQVFLKAVRGLDPERSPQARYNWLSQVARTTLADYWRDYYRRRSTSLEELLVTGWDDQAAEESAVDSLGGSDPAERVQRLLQALPDRDREVLTCRFLLQLSVRETATRLGITEANVKIVQFRALKRAALVEDAASRHL